MKILMMVKRLNIGGTEKYILSVSQYFKSRGVQIGIASMGGPLGNSFKRLEIPIHLLPSQNNTWVNRVSSLSSIISKGKYEIVHVHDSNSFHYTSALHRLRRKVPIFATVHGTYHNRTALLSVSKAATRIITVSPKLSKWLIGQKIPAYKIQMIPNGIDTSVFTSLSNKSKWRKELNLPQRAQILVHAGRFSWDKYPIARKVILAAEIIARKNRNFVVVLFGPGSYRLKLIQLAAEVNRRLGRKVIYIRPSLSHIQHAYFAADVIVGTGRVALEAMACARPVVAVGIAGYCGVVEPKNINRIIQYHFGDHGSFAPATVERLAKDINILLANPNQARRLGKFGAETINRRFSIKKVGSRLLQVYKKQK